MKKIIGMFIFAAILLVGAKIVSASSPSLICSSSIGSTIGSINTDIKFYAYRYRGDGNIGNFNIGKGSFDLYTWSAPDAVPSSGTGQSFIAQYSNPGSYLVTVSKNTDIAVCKVTVQ